MSETNKINNTMREELRKEFPTEAYSKHPTKTFLTTLKAMYVTERLNDVFGVGRWTIDHEVIERTTDYVLIQGEFKSLDYEVSVPKQYGGHKTTGTNTEIADGFKSAITDCISKIASYLEIGIDMFKGKIIIDGQAQKSQSQSSPSPTKWLNQFIDKKETEIDRDWNRAIATLKAGKTIKDIRKLFMVSKDNAIELERQAKL